MIEIEICKWGPSGPEKFPWAEDGIISIVLPEIDEGEERGSGEEYGIDLDYADTLGLHAIFFLILLDVHCGTQYYRMACKLKAEYDNAKVL